MIDTCDRCGAICTSRGIVATHKDGRKLILCPAHEREHATMLAKQGWDVVKIVDRFPSEQERGELDQAYCRCGALVDSRLVKPNKDSKMVRVTICPKCDSRECGTQTPDGRCDDRTTDRTQAQCKSGHDLMGRPR